MSSPSSSLTDHARLAELERRLFTLEAESAIRGLVARYMEICDDLDPHTDFDELGSLFGENAKWLGGGASYEQAFGVHNGRAEIVAFLRGYAEPPHFASNAHFLTSETINVDGETAEGSWMMLQMPSFACGESFVLAAQLKLGFVFEDGAWRIDRFLTTNLLDRQIEGQWRNDSKIPTPNSTPEKGD